MHCDEATVQVLKEPGKEARSQSYMWVKVSGPPTQPIRLFQYTDSRIGDVARQLLASYRGYVQTDHYAGNHVSCSDDNITQLAVGPMPEENLSRPTKSTPSKRRPAKRMWPSA
ncbi:MAG: transposase [Candidatus Thiodiazotropha sp.]